MFSKYNLPTMRKTIEIVIIFIISFLNSCDKIIISEDDNIDKSTVRVIPKSITDSPLEYPLFLYVFTDQGNLIASQKTNSPDEELSFKLTPNNTYKIVAVSGATDQYKIPSSPSLFDDIAFVSNHGLANGYAVDSPLLMGISDITPTLSNSSVHIQMNYQVASLNITLKGLPAETQIAYVMVSGCVTSISMDGTPKDNNPVRIPCEKNGDSWQSGIVYVLPGKSNKTTFTIAYIENDEEVFASATYMAPLLMATPYIINGTYDDGQITITGNITPPSWQKEVNLDFSFNKEKNTIIDSVNSTEYNVTSIPAAGSIWEGHVVAISTPTSLTTATITLLSLRDFNNIHSSFNTEHQSQAKDIADHYNEQGINGWAIPTESQAKKIYQVYHNTDIINTLAEADGDPLVLTEGGSNIRYLCEEAKKTYSFNVNTIIDAGATVKSYHLRLIKDIDVKLNEP